MSHDADQPKSHSAPGSSSQWMPGMVVAERYIIMKVAGRGSLGTLVYQATDRVSGTQVAIKRQRWPEGQHEALVLERLNHPAIPAFHALVQVGDFSCLVTDFVEGETLAWRLARQRRLEVAEIQRLGLALLEVLAYLHHQAPFVCFADLSPDNIMLQPDGSMMLIDFGEAELIDLAKEREIASAVTWDVSSAQYILSKAAAPAVARRLKKARKTLEGLRAVLLELPNDPQEATS